MKSNIFLIIGYVPMLAMLVTFIVIIFKKSHRRSLSFVEPERPMRLLEEDANPLKVENYELIYDKFRQMLESDKVFLDPELRVTKVAAKLYTNRTYLAKAIKFKTGRNFCHVVNQYRVREAMRVYVNDPHLTVEQLARRVGFNSMTTFGTAFKLNTGYTPIEWCKDYVKKNKIGSYGVSKKTGRGV